MRLDKFICDCTELTRSQAGKVIRQGLVTVDQQLCKQPSTQVNSSQQIELDGEFVDGFRVVSREVIEVALRDEQHYLRACDQDAEEEEAIATLYPDGFSAQAFIRVIERSEVWRGLL